MTTTKLQSKYEKLWKNKTQDPESLMSFIKEHEPLLKEDPDNYTLFPLKYPDIFQAYIKHRSLYWIPDEIKYDEDLESWSKLNADEKHFIENILAFFAGADGIVMKNINVNFAAEVQVQEAILFYNFQNMIEGIHSETYSRLIDIYIKNPIRKKTLFTAVTTIPSIKKKALWAENWFDSKKHTFAERLVAFCAVEGIFFSGAFCSIYWLKERGLMTKALAVSNEFIARDEGMHCLYSILLYKHLLFKLPDERIQEIFRSAVELEVEFITESLPCNLIGINSKMMTQYLFFLTDYRLEQFGVPKIFNTTNPFPFMEKLGMNGKSNFFEKTVTEYSAAPATNKYDFDFSDTSF